MPWQAVRYLIAGGSSYLIEIGFLRLLQGAGAGRVAAVATSFWIGTAASFVLQKMFTFWRRQPHYQTHTQLLLTLLLVGFNYLFTLVFVAATSGLLTLVEARTAAIVLTTVWNFFFFRTVVFKARSETA